MVMITRKPSIPLQLRQKNLNTSFFLLAVWILLGCVILWAVILTCLEKKGRSELELFPVSSAFVSSVSQYCWRAVWLCCGWEGCKKYSKHQILFCTCLPALNQGGRVGLVEAGVQHSEPCCKMTFKWQSFNVPLGPDVSASLFFSRAVHPVCAFCLAGWVSLRAQEPFSL